MSWHLWFWTAGSSATLHLWWLRLLQYFHDLLSILRLLCFHFWFISSHKEMQDLCNGTWWHISFHDFSNFNDLVSFPPLFLCGYILRIEIIQQTSTDFWSSCHLRCHWYKWALNWRVSMMVRFSDYCKNKMAAPLPRSYASRSTRSHPYGQCIDQRSLS